MISREAELVVNLVSAYVRGADGESVAAMVKPEIDWNEVERIATWHAVVPILYQVLAARPDCAPAEQLARWHGTVRANRVRNAYLENAVVRIAKALADRGVTALAFKGPVLAAAAYGDPGLREFIDLDILVRPSDLGPCRATLAALGYRSEYSGLSDEDKTFFQSYQETFNSDDWLVPLDVHSRLNPRYFAYAPEGEALFRRAVEFELRSGGVKTLSNTDLVIHLCAHGAKHGWDSLGWILDIAAFVRRNPEIDWRSMLNDAAAAGGRRLLLLGIYLIRDLLKAPIPEEVMALALGDRVVTRIAAGVKRGLFSNIGRRGGVIGEWSAPARAIESTRGRIRYVAARALGPTIEDWKSLPLPRPLYPLYYAVHPLRMAFTQAPRIFRSLVGISTHAAKPRDPRLAEA